MPNVYARPELSRELYDVVLQNTSAGLVMIDKAMTETHDPLMKEALQKQRKYHEEFLEAMKRGVVN